MTTLSIHELDPAVEQRLRDRAARHGHSVEEEVAHTLAEAFGRTEDEPQNAYDAMRRHFRDLEGAGSGASHTTSCPRGAATRLM